MSRAQRRHDPRSLQPELLYKGRLEVLVRPRVAMDGNGDNAQLAGALDVFPFEPLPADHRILNTPRLTVTPHLGGASKEAARIAARIGAEDIQRWLNGQTPKNAVNPDVLEGR